MTDNLTLALERTEESANALALTLVGGMVGDWIITDREKPGKRWFYVLAHTLNGDIKRLRGYEVVRLARQATIDGVAVVMPREPWRSASNLTSDPTREREGGR